MITRLLAFAACLAVAAAGCGMSDRPDLPVGCRPAEVGDLMAGLTAALGKADRAASLRYIEQSSGLIGVTLYEGRGPDARRDDLESPSAIYAGLTRALAGPSDPRLLAAAVGGSAPETAKRPGNGGSPTAGVEFVVLDGAYSLAGKVGVDCDSGRIYVGAVNLRRGLDRRQMCGGYVSRSITDLRICSIHYQ